MLWVRNEKDRDVRRWQLEMGGEGSVEGKETEEMVWGG